MMFLKGVLSGFNPDFRYTPPLHYINCKQKNKKESKTTTNREKKSGLNRGKKWIKPHGRKS